MRNALCLLLLAAPTLCTADEKKRASEGRPEPGFVRLFNGKDLAGWEGDPKVWSVHDGTIRCESPKDGKRNWLVWRDGELADFELRLRFRFLAGNSGVQVRSKEIKKCWVQGYQVEVAQKSKMGLWHHSIAPAKHRSHLATAGQRVHIRPDGTKQLTSFAEPEKVQAAYRENDWNDLTVLAEGARLVQIINGKVFAELVDEEEQFSSRSGVLAFQDHGHGTVVEFKDIRLKRLP
jgi:hypothetical protein